MPDTWEAAYSITDPNGDADGDGQSNLQEYGAGTDPTNSSSLLRITSVARQTNGQFVVTWPSIGGTATASNTPTVEPSGFPTMTDAVRSLFQEMDPATYGSGSTQVFTDDFTLTVPATNGARFYRIKVVP